MVADWVFYLNIIPLWCLLVLIAICTIIDENKINHTRDQIAKYDEQIKALRQKVDDLKAIVEKKLFSKSTIPRPYNDFP